jgi:Zn-finger nucleic acid-binding protein
MTNTSAFYFVSIIAIVAVVVHDNYRKRVTAPQPNTPILLSYYTNGIDLAYAQQGIIANMHYSALLGMDQDGGGQSLIYRVELPFQTSSHIVGIPKHSGAVQLNPAAKGSAMERVVLEGNYDNYFTLYAERGSGSDTQYVLNPTAMIFTIDFCQSQNWEIVDNELYFVQAFGTGDKKDMTSMEQDVATFVEKIRPALEVTENTFENPNNVPYGQDRRTNLVCPICQTTMTNDDQYFSCPKQHGYLLTGQSLIALKNGSLVLPPLPVGSSVDHKLLQCPGCGFEMSPVEYDGSVALEIDACPHCPYRWLDGVDVPAIKR